jgi:hypothetical protein
MRAFDDFEKTMIDFRCIIDLAIRVSDLVKDNNGNEKDIIASNIFAKSTMSALSIWSMTEESSDNVFKRKVYDIPSAFILLRSIFEAYKVFNHILVSPLSEEEKELRIFLFRRHSMYERQELVRLTNGGRYK